MSDNDAWIISDDIYEKLIYEPAEFCNMAMACPALKDRVIIAHGLSKTYSMTGWRIGFMAGPPELAQAVTKLQSQMTSNPNSIAQKAALAALTGPQSCVKQFRDIFAHRRRLALNILSQIPGLSCPEPQGAFYLFPDVSKHFGRNLGGVEILGANHLASILLEECKVAIVPGSGFGQDNAIRLSYATSEEELSRGLTRIGEFLAK
jgi:aspartate aminotransferase